MPWPCQHVTLPLVSSKPTTSPLYAISHSLMTWDSKNYSEINNLTVKSLVLNLLIKNNSYKFISETKNVFKSGLKNSLKKSHKLDFTNNSDQSENSARVGLPLSTKSKEHSMVKHSPSKPFPKLMPSHHPRTRLLYKMKLKFWRLCTMIIYFVFMKSLSLKIPCIWSWSNITVET